jgi:plastocyanin
LRSASPRPFVIGALFSFMLVLGACSGGADGTPAGTPAGSTSRDNCARVEDGVITITADDLAFSAPCMVATAGEAFTIHFENLEAQVHNVSLYTDSSKGNELMRGETITGPDAEVDYAVEALEAGEYYFDCMVHPAMSGTLFVEA